MRRETLFGNFVTFKLSAVVCELAILIASLLHEFAIITASLQRGSTTLFSRVYHKIMLSLSLFHMQMAKALM